MYLDARWITPTHLNVTYSRRAELDFQVAKCFGIDISVTRTIDKH